MSVSAMFSASMMVAMPNSIGIPGGGATKFKAAPRIPIGGAAAGGNNNGLVIECSSRPQKKATAHHKKTRPRKSQPWDIRRGPAVYPPLPPLPAEWTLVTDEADSAAAQSAVSSPEPVQS
ncbi:OLC1v1017090C1 [Oldenlandia corymbosa var. corymbosa]|uniref:OLC1v1017090C1 n=1 Tax=Oldenlandia corymbosa var. corymbosa TaxID=529605 RepID=A0AAV1E8N4_OLDCO|nr:OLC1v1017090C1 [Oldenlandia corymbosa var. corymbosa]